MLAVQFTTALSKIGQVPNDLIVSLLSNVSYGKCRELISRMNEVEYREHKRCLISAEDYGENPPKKLKSELPFGRFRGVLGRGKIEMVNDGENSCPAPANAINMKVTWKHDMMKCVDASPMVLIYEK